jgi:probable rRNA maturation factor
MGRPDCDVHVSVVDDREIHRLNRRYLGARRPTDVLAFNLELGAGTPVAPRPRLGGPSRPAASRTVDVVPFTGSPEPSRLLGEVIISGETAARQAARLGIPAALEMDLLLVHGLLHLLGYDDHAPARARLMHERAREILSGSRRRPLPEGLFTGLLDRDAGAPSPPGRTRDRQPSRRPIRAAVRGSRQIGPRRQDPSAARVAR